MRSRRQKIPLHPGGICHEGVYEMAENIEQRSRRLYQNKKKKARRESDVEPDLLEE